MKRKRSCLGQPLLWPQPSDIAECFFWLPFFQGSGSCLASPTGCCSHLLPHNKFWLITARKKWVLWKYLHSPLVLLGSIIKKDLRDPLSPALKATWYIRSKAIWVWISLQLPCAHLPLRADLDQAWSSTWWADWLSYHKLSCICTLVLFVFKYMFTVTDFFKIEIS